MDARSKVKPATGWQRPLAFPIKLRDGHVVETMAQAVALTQRLPKARQLKMTGTEIARPVVYSFAALDGEGWA